MTTHFPVPSVSRLLPLPAAVRKLLGVAGVAMLLAACGHGQAPKSSAPAASAATSAHVSAGSAAPAELPGVAATAASAAATSQQQVQQQAQQQAAAAAAAAKAKLASMSVNDLLTAARQAYSQHKLVAPVGDSAMEYYEAALAKDPKNQVAKDALRETFPFAANDVDKAISQNNFDEAAREIAVLAKADPSNYTLTLLRSKLDAQQKQQARQQQEQQQKAQKAADLAQQQKTAAQKAAQEQAASARLAAAQAAAQKEAAAAKPAPAAVASAPAVAPKPAGITRGVEVVKAVSPDAPIEAIRNHVAGFAVVAFTVTATGTVTGAHIVQSQPRHVFDSAALTAVKRSTYKPAMQDGQPVAANMERRYDFKF